MALHPFHVEFFLLLLLLLLLLLTITVDHVCGSYARG